MTKRVLIAEDDALIAMGFEMVLEEAGFQVTVTYDGQAALDQYRRHAVDLVMVDIGLPKISGLDLVRTIRRQNPDQRFLIVSGNVRRGAVHDDVPGRAIPFLVKPVSLTELVNAVHSSLNEPVA